MNNQLVTHLSERAIESLFDNFGKKIKSVVQFVRSETKVLNQRELMIATLSDGFFFESFIVFPNIVDSFTKSVKPNDILDAGLVKKEQNNNFMILYEFNVIYSMVPSQIGEPLKFEAGKSNPRGSNAIPDAVIFGDKGSGNAGGNALPEEFKQNAQPFHIEMDRSDTSPDHFTEIASLGHYDRSFKIRGRVIKKSPMRSFKRKDGSDGYVFNVIIKDSTKGIQVTFFNDMAKKFLDALELESVYSFSEMEIKPAGKFNSTDNKFELSVHDRSVIQKLPDAKDISTVYFNFVTIRDIANKKEGDNLDVIAIVEDPGLLTTVSLKTGESKAKKGIKLCDDTGFSVEVSLWGDEASNNKLRKGDLVIFTDVRVKEYNGKFLSFGMNSKILTSMPDHPRFKELLLFKNQGMGGPTKSLVESRDYSLSLAKLSQVEEFMANQNVYSDDRHGFTFVGSLVRFMGNLFYESCDNENCMKKVTPNSRGTFDCDKCNKSISKPRLRFMTTLKLADDSGSLVAMVSGDDNCQLIFKRPIEEVNALKLSNEKEYNELIRSVLFQEFRVRVLAKWETYNENTRVRYQAIKLVSTLVAPDSLTQALQSNFQ